MVHSQWIMVASAYRATDRWNGCGWKVPVWITPNGPARQCTRCKPKGSQKKNSALEELQIALTASCFSSQAPQSRPTWVWMKSSSLYHAKWANQTVYKMQTEGEPDKNSALEELNSYCGYIPHVQTHPYCLLSWNPRVRCWGRISFNLALEGFQGRFGVIPQLHHVEVGK